MSEKTQEAPQKTAKEHIPPLNAKEEAAEIFKTALIAVTLAVIIRTFMYEPFNIPSGSMKPTLDIGDYLFVDKPAYGYSKHSFPYSLAPLEGRVWVDLPKRGDVVVFKKPTDMSIDYIKRLMGMPGDTIQMKKGRLYINGEKIEREAIGLRKADNGYGGETSMVEYLQTLPDGTSFHILEESDEEPLDNTPLYTVPEGHYFMMGDNRDNSSDSRVMNEVGFVPFENFVGRADFLFFSTNGYAHIWEFWKWPWSIRYSRLFMGIDPDRPEDEDKSQKDAE